MYIYKVKRHSEWKRCKDLNIYNNYTFADTLFIWFNKIQCDCDVVVYSERNSIWFQTKEYLTHAHNIIIQ